MAGERLFALGCGSDVRRTAPSLTSYFIEITSN